MVKQLIMDMAGEAGLGIQSGPVRETDLENAEEVFLTNSIHGIQWIKSYKNTTFGHSKSNQLSKLLSQYAQKSDSI